MEGRRAAVEQIRRDRMRAARGEEGFHLGKLFGGFQDHGIVAAERQSSARISEWDDDKEDIGEGRKRPVIELPAGSRVVVGCHGRHAFGQKGAAAPGYDSESRCGKRE